MAQKRRASSGSSWSPENVSSSRKSCKAEINSVEPRAKNSSSSCADSKTISRKREDFGSRFIGEAVSDDEARKRWPHRYQAKKGKIATAATKLLTDDDADDILVPAFRHYLQAKVDGVVFDLNDDAHVKAEDKEDNYICRIVEMFETADRKPFFCAQWFYRAKDTVITMHGDLIDKKRIFLSEIKNDNPLDCLLEKLKIVRVAPNVDLDHKRKTIPDCDYYYDMLYFLPYSTYMSPPPENVESGGETSSTVSSDSDVCAKDKGNKSDSEHRMSEMSLLDLYSGCGAMSSGLCLGANMGGINLVTKWAIDLNQYACESLRLNHPETQVRNVSAEDFLSLVQEWEKLCFFYSLIPRMQSKHSFEDPFAVQNVSEGEGGSDEDDDDVGNGTEIFEVGKILSMSYGDPNDAKKKGLYFKVRWQGYGSSEDTWEPISGLRNCQEVVKKYVTDGYKSRLLPLPGDVDMVCGGPPCQGISGFNRFRNKENPLEDEKNKQLAVFMNLVEYLKPKYVLMENVVDILKFSGGFLGRYALGRLVAMNYQVRMGMMVAGAYGLPQFRNRVLLWGARPALKVPQFPLPTHDVVLRGHFPIEFERNGVAYDEGHKVELQPVLLLEDAISDMPPVTNDEEGDEIICRVDAKTKFQRFIRLSKEGMEEKAHRLFDHRPLKLNADDYQRVCQIPKRKGANFRDLPGVRVRPDNHVEWDPEIERVLLPSGKPLVPDYAMTFVRGSSTKPFGRLWWDNTVSTVVTRAEPHNQAILHPQQDRVLTVRENARLQGFPDYYKLCGPVKQRYVQVGNAVAFPVARALGYSLAKSCQGLADDEPLFTLPPDFPNVIDERRPSVSSDAGTP